MKNFKNVSNGTWARLALLVAALLNTVLTVFGVNPLAENSTAAAVLGTVATVIISLLAYWKNNSFTEAAQVADKIMNELKKS